MKANYHTHSNFCDHASGDVEEYIKAAIEVGMTELGISEHGSYIFPDGYESRYRIKKARVSEYVKTVKELAEKYKDKIKIQLGFELEYYPDYFDTTLEFVKNAGIEYLILGQHFLDNERGPHFFKECGPQELDEYTECVTAAIKTGAFTYIAHPDCINFIGDGRVYEEYAKKLCAAAKEYKIPLEFNLLGFSTGRHYPKEQFFKIAAETGCDVILGVDAHSPNDIRNTETVKKAKEFLGGLGITPIETVKLRKLEK